MNFSGLSIDIELSFISKHSRERLSPLSAAILAIYDFLEHTFLCPAAGIITNKTKKAVQQSCTAGATGARPAVNQL